MKISLTVSLLLLAVCTFSQNLTIDWAVKNSGLNTNQDGKAIVVDLLGNVYITGTFVGSVDFDPGPGIQILSSTGSSDNFYVQKLNPNGELLWVKSFGNNSTSISASCEGWGIDLDGSSNVYITGEFSDTVDFDPGINSFLLSSNGGFDVFILKLTSTGDFLWAHQEGSWLDDLAFKVKVKNTGKVLILGSFKDSVDFDSGPGVDQLYSDGGYNTFIQEFDNNGNHLWVKSLYSSNHNQGQDLDIDSLGNIYISGSYSGTTDFDPSSDTYLLTSSFSGQDCFVLKLDPIGELIWVKSMGGMYMDVSTAIAVDADGNVFTGGYYEGQPDFDPGVGIVLLPDNGFQSMYLQKLDSSGNLNWVYGLGGIAYNAVYDIVVDNYGDIYSTGYTAYSSDFNPGAGVNNIPANSSNDVVLYKLKSDGSYGWAYAIGATNIDQGNALALDNENNFYCTGYFTMEVDFDPSANNYSMVADGVGSDAFIVKYSLDDTYLGIDDDPISEMKIYPNPTTSDFTLDLGNYYQSIELTITNISGEIIEQKAFQSTSKIVSNIEGVPGCYFVKIKTNDDTVVNFKLLKH
jgi:hypothetical protein